MAQAPKPATAALLAFALACSAGSSRAVQGYSAPDVKACKLMPTEELEKRFSGRVTNPHGEDEGSSICTANIGGLAIKLESAPPGASGVPTSVPQGLAGARMMLGQAKQAPDTNTKNFGKVGCFRMKITKGFDGKSLANPLVTTSCFLVEGGYLNISLSGENGKPANFELVKALLEKAAARR